MVDIEMACSSPAIIPNPPIQSLNNSPGNMDAETAKKEWADITDDHASCSCGGSSHCGGHLGSMWREGMKDHFQGPCEHKAAPYHFPSLEEARSEACGRAENISEYWNHLKKVLGGHEATIQRRWMNKSTQKRKDLLLQAWPDIARRHRPDVEAFRTDANMFERLTSRNTYLFPHLNLEDLSKPKLLLLLLNARGRNNPASFVMADYDTCLFGFAARGLFRPSINGHLMVFDELENPEEYGKILGWEDNAEILDYVKSRQCLLPGGGFCVLELQEGLHLFLLSCCRLILHDLTHDALIGQSIMPQSGSVLVSSDEGELPSLATIAAETPYTTPSALDVERLLSIIRAKLSAAEDHLWALREDPGFFAETIQCHMEHRVDLLEIVDENDKLHPPVLEDPRLAGKSRSTSLERAIEAVVQRAVGDLDTWKELERSISELLVMREHYEGVLKLGKDLPGDYSFAFHRLEHHLLEYATGKIARLTIAFYASPPLRHYCFRRWENDRLVVGVNRLRATNKDSRVRMELSWMFKVIGSEGLPNVPILNTLINELGRRMEGDSEVRNLISGHVADLLSDLSVLLLCVRQIQLCHPGHATKVGTVVGCGEYCEDLKKTDKYIHALESRNLGKMITGLGDPKNGRFSYPVNKRRTGDNVKKMMEAEKKLDLFWEALDKKMRRIKAISPFLEQTITQRHLHRTFEHDVLVFDSKPKKKDIEELMQPMSEIDFEREYRSERTLIQKDEAESKEKRKTRGIAELPEADSSHTGAPGVASEDPQSTFTVDRRALKTFRTLFFTPSISAVPGEMAWRDFLHAMVSVGFSAQQLHGSAWQFSPTRLNANKAIQFHEPHPSTKLPYPAARRYGRRLSRTYGWHAETFVLAEAPI
ncbi:hypothetical protein MMC10_009203 [Thelotrema lepadinum]|nr:hypothetical protein [Thelotrema lepadinum]